MVSSSANKNSFIYFLYSQLVCLFFSCLIALAKTTGDVRDVGAIPGSGRLPGGGHGTHSNILAWRIPMDRRPWGATVHRVA